MSIGDVLVILGCLAGGYWIVSSVMGPGVDLTRRAPPPPPDAGHPAPTDAKALVDPRRSDWHLLLDVPRSADRAEIEAAWKRQHDRALAAFDTRKIEQLRLARDAALAQLAR